MGDSSPLPKTYRRHSVHVCSLKDTPEVQLPSPEMSFEQSENAVESMALEQSEDLTKATKLLFPLDYGDEQFGEAQRIIMSSDRVCKVLLAPEKLGKVQPVLTSCAEEGNVMPARFFDSTVLRASSPAHAARNDGTDSPRNGTGMFCGCLSERGGKGGRKGYRQRKGGRDE